MFSRVLDRYTDNLPVGVKFNQNILIDIAGLSNLPVRKNDQKRICTLKISYVHVALGKGVQ